VLEDVIAIASLLDVFLALEAVAVDLPTETITQLFLVTLIQ
jgi:hypothetical protein